MFEDEGYAIIPQVIDTATCEAVIAQLACEKTAGTRNFLGNTWCQEVARVVKSHRRVTELLPSNAAAVQCIFFDKSPEKNWMVPFHQDLSVPVAAKVKHPECTRWSEKEGFLYLQAPDHILASLLAVRINLDDCGPNDGPLRILPGSHLHGRVEEGQIAAERQRKNEVICSGQKGDALVMHPLLLHASSKTDVPSFRRVLHFLFGPVELPYGLRWPLAI